MAVRDLSDTAALDLWQAADELGPVERALALASAASDAPVDELAGLPIGRRDARVLELHTALGRQALEATATCPSCGEPVEFAVGVAELLARDEAAGAPVALGVAWRPPDSRDVAAAAAAGDAVAAEEVLLARCVRGDVSRAALCDAIADCDPLAEVRADVVCPACEAAFVADLDVASFVWAEVRTRALRLLRDVDELARAYGWTEAEVLALDERRRRAYLELVREGGR